MAITRRAFLGSLGVGAAAVAFGGVSLPASVGTLTVEASTEAAVAFGETLRVGDIFTIAGRYAFNPVTRKPTKHLQSFMVTAIVGDDVSVTPFIARPVKRADVMPLATR